jgi:metallo-beta-lactamase family protein
MNIKVTSYEGFKNQIGACILIETDRGNFLLDCGLRENIPILTEPISLPFSAKDIDAVFLSHGHLGHCGFLPELMKNGFAGKIYCTAPTKSRAYLGLLEASLVQSEGFVRSQKRMQASEELTTSPFYSKDLVEKTQGFIEEINYNETFQSSEGISVTYFSAGHCPGSAIIKMNISNDQQTKTILYLGDVGNNDNDLYHPQILNESYDVVILPRLTEKDTHPQDTAQQLCEIINQAHKKTGNVIISAFSLDRRIELMHIIDDLLVKDL